MMDLLALHLTERMHSGQHTILFCQSIDYDHIVSAVKIASLELCLLQGACQPQLLQTLNPYFLSDSDYFLSPAHFHFLHPHWIVSFLLLSPFGPIFFHFHLFLDKQNRPLLQGSNNVLYDQPYLTKSVQHWTLSSLLVRLKGNLKLKRKSLGVS